MKKKELFIFDYDGVLVFSVVPTFACLISTVSEFKIKEPSMDMLRKYWGRSFVDDLFPGLAEELAWNFFQHKYIKESFLKKNAELVYPLPEHLAEFLKEIRQQGKDLAILSNRSLESLIACSNRLNLDLNNFKRIICPSNGLFKPDPRIFDVFWQLGYQPAETVFIGDSIVYDLAAAKNHRPPIDFIAISSGLHSQAEFLKAGLSEDLILKSPVEISKWL